MKRSIFKNLRAELVIYSVLSMILAVFTEGIIIFILSVVGSALGISDKGYGRVAAHNMVGREEKIGRASCRERV